MSPPAWVQSRSGSPARNLSRVPFVREEPPGQGGPRKTHGFRGPRKRHGCRGSVQPLAEGRASYSIGADLRVRSARYRHCSERSGHRHLLIEESVCERPYTDGGDRLGEVLELIWRYVQVKSPATQSRWQWPWVWDDAVLLDALTCRWRCTPWRVPHQRARRAAQGRTGRGAW
jgi:hypothetical protein